MISDTNGLGAANPLIKLALLCYAGWGDKLATKILF